MKNKKLLNIIGDINDKYILEAEPKTNGAYRSKKLTLLIASIPIAICFTILLIMFIPLFKNNHDDFSFGLSNGVKVKYVDDLPGVASESDLMWLTEEELFGEKIHDLNIVAFEGIVEGIRNIVIDFNGSEDYRAIAEVQVKDVLRGNLAEGSTVEVLLPGPINTNVSVSETTISQQIAVGQTGIFMPVIYDENSMQEQDGKKLVLSELAQYGILDGERWLFLETTEGLIFNKEAYPSLREVENFTELKEKIKDKVK